MSHPSSVSTRVIRPLNVMVTSACDRGTAPTGASTPKTGGFERLRLRPHQKPTCSRGRTRRDTSRRSAFHVRACRLRRSFSTPTGACGTGGRRRAIAREYFSSRRDGPRWRPVNDILANYWTPSTSVSWSISTRMTGARPPASLARQQGRAPSISIGVGRSALDVMVTSACDRGMAPTGATTSQTGGFPSA